eukprot:scaffold15805_cov213-Isochrysis_galbana.AAC.3
MRVPANYCTARRTSSCGCWPLRFEKPREGRGRDRVASLSVVERGGQTRHGAHRCRPAHLLRRLAPAWPVPVLKPAVSPRPRALECDPCGIEDADGVRGVERHVGGGGPGGARLEGRVLQRELQHLALVELPVEADLDATNLLRVDVEVELGRDLVLAVVQGRHELDARRLGLDQPRRLYVERLVAQLELARRADLAQLVGRIIHGAQLVVARRSYEGWAWGWVKTCQHACTQRKHCYATGTHAHMCSPVSLTSV